MNAICDIILQFYLKGKCNFTLRIATTNPSGEERADEILTLLKPLLIDDVTIHAQVERSRFAEKPDTKIHVALPPHAMALLSRYQQAHDDDDSIEDHISDILVDSLELMDKEGDIDG
jgi:hypothetical protein